MIFPSGKHCKPGGFVRWAKYHKIAESAKRTVALRSWCVKVPDAIPTPRRCVIKVARPNPTSVMVRVFKDFVLAG